MMLHIGGSEICNIRIIMDGILYGLGVGPGDPELITIKALRIMEKADVIACPARGTSPGIAYQIAEQVYPDIALKEILLLDFPMDKGDQSTVHQKAAEKLIAKIREGKKVAFLTLGDPALYSTFSYISEIIRAEGYQVEMVSGVTSFSAAAARLLISIASGDEPVLITTGEIREFDGTLIVMKAGRHLKALKEKIAKSGKTVYLVENCGMPDEKVYYGIESIPNQTGYFSTLIIKSR